LKETVYGKPEILAVALLREGLSLLTLEYEAPGFSETSGTTDAKQQGGVMNFVSRQNINISTNCVADCL
jgi:2-iminoacetate synthase ThiH